MIYMIFLPFQPVPFKAGMKGKKVLSLFEGEIEKRSIKFCVSCPKTKKVIHALWLSTGDPAQ
jgi:hypothetical protein